MEKKNILVIILVIIIAILCLIIGWLLGSKFADTEKDSKLNTEENNKLDVNKNESSSYEETEKDSIELKNYNIDEIKNLEIRVPVKDASEPEMKKVTITDKEEITSILLNVDDTKEIGKVPEGIGFMFNVVITINYNGDPSTDIVLLDNGNIAINKAVGVGETGYTEHEIQNKTLASELINKYQVKE